MIPAPVAAARRILDEGIGSKYEQQAMDNGKPHPSLRSALACCMQHGLQRTAGFVWRNTETLERAKRRRMREIRSDPAQMLEVRRLARALMGLMPE